MDSSNHPKPRECVMTMPKEVMEACASGDPQAIFHAASKHYNPVALGIMTQRPYSGGPLLGFEPIIDGVCCVMNGFCVSYIGEDGKNKQEILGLDDIVKLKFTCISSALAHTMRLADPEAGKRAMEQVPAVAKMLKDAGVPSGLNSGGKWGKKSGSIYKTVPFGASDGDSENPIIATVEAAARKRLDELLQDVPEDRKSPGEVVSVDSPGGQAIMRAYLDLVNAAHALNTAEYNGSALDLGLKEFVWNRSTGAATTWCFVFSAFVGIVFVLVAVLISIWGFDVHGVPTNNITALAAYIDGVQVSSSPNMTCSIEAQNTFKLDKFLGYPDTNVFWNLYGGLVLGLIFGFLDNFGLFYGMGALDSFFYGFGSKVAAGLMSLFRPNAKSSADAAELLIDLHTVTSDLMAGLGNTFSDLLGVALGTAALEIAKAGLNVDPAFWVLDLVAIVLGCLLGCFMPVLVKHKALLGGRSNDNLIATIAWINIFGLFAAVFLAGVPYLTFNVISVVIVCINITFLVLLLSVTYLSGASVLSNAVAHLKK